MPIPEKITLYHEKNLLDRVIDNVASQDKALSVSDLNKVSIAAQVQQGIDRYRAEAASLSTLALFEEEHSSKRLANHLVQAGYRRPPRCHAHAIVAGKHALSAQLRLIMAKLKIRIDDSDNGCWLPENTAATPHPAFPKAPPHSRIHRYAYYFWIDSRLSAVRNETHFRTHLNLIGKMLVTGQFPKEVLLPKKAVNNKSGILK